jgi:hypothetical protein
VCLVSRASTKAIVSQSSSTVVSILCLAANGATNPTNGSLIPVLVSAMFGLAMLVPSDLVQRLPRHPSLVVIHTIPSMVLVPGGVLEAK